MHTIASTSTIAYKAVGDYYLPQITVPAFSAPIGHWGRLREAYLRQSRPILFQTMLTNGTLNDHLAEVDRQAGCRLEKLIP